MGVQLRAGAAEVTITPPLGVSMAGLFKDRRAKGVLTDLQAKALVLDDGRTPVVIITVDLCHIDPEVAATARSRIEAELNIPAERVMLSCTHTHSGPATYSTPWYGPDAPYLDVLARRIGDAAILAYQRLRDARLLAGIGAESSISFNRRYWMADGSLRTNPPLQSPEIVRPAGPIDPEISTLRIEDSSGKLIALLVNFALHVAVVAGEYISADYPGTLSSLIRKLEGPDAVVMFALGCCGDINHVDVYSPGPQSGQAVADRIGTVLAGDVIGIGPRMAPIRSENGIGFGRKVLDLDLRLPSEDEVAWARQRVRSEMKAMDAAGMEVVTARRICWIQERNRPSIPVDVQALTIGNVAYLTLPAEIFTELGLSIKRRSPYLHTLIGTLNGGSPGFYIPTAKAYGEGGYEVGNSPVVPGSGERLVEAALELLETAGN